MALTHSRDEELAQVTQYSRLLAFLVMASSLLLTLPSTASFRMRM
jgi:hypothetical protein